MATATQTVTAPKQSASNGESTNGTTTNDPHKAALASLERDGFVVLHASLFPTFDLESLRKAAARTTEAARSGKWPYIRTLPKQVCNHKSNSK